MITVDPKRLNLRPGQRVLDLGCGEGRHAIHLLVSEPVKVVGVDLKFADVQTARERVQPFVVGTQVPGSLLLGVANGLQLPFADNSFDVVICSEVLEHIEDYTGVLAEIDRVLKPGGLFAASVPTYFPEWVCWRLSDEYHQVEGGHIRIFRERELRRSIEKLGHLCFARHKAHALHTPYWWLKCLLWHRPESRLLAVYHRLLVWDLMQKPRLTRLLEKLLDPLLGKSIVLYFVKSPQPIRSLPEQEAPALAVESAA
ncbi:class I SAM-dependent methyltransferase [Microbulbifer rhizosphaerae]|uniref:Ubiquinone/menaquinone biosynthesis C-methylase UbiE n=1 Tax=Microbulbifer rhizosphaerae TaxID=1562603 RepID=A0A7W4W9X6_9GAMM|nr:class I SAM-dependent methyltransferase [Microbulbifer rhizosphaerae]MBB3060365.1 ubiquinone/menaquinone biosynthesis C-methylase UbiE [Microbulbifer rhizosphaerae]